jgi:hypothetical protein
MDPVILKEWSSEKEFILYDAGAYTPLCSHTLLFRAMGGIHAGPSIDLIFLGLDYSELATRLRGARISRPRDEQALEFAKGFIPHYDAREAGDRVYAVESQSKRFHIIAANFWIHIHTKPLLESSLIPLCNDDLDKHRAYFEQCVSEWYKID